MLREIKSYILTTVLPSMTVANGYNYTYQVKDGASLEGDLAGYSLATPVVELMSYNSFEVNSELDMAFQSEFQTLTDEDKMWFLRVFIDSNDFDKIDKAAEDLVKIVNCSAYRNLNGLGRWSIYDSIDKDNQTATFKYILKVGILIKFEKEY